MKHGGSKYMLRLDVLFFRYIYIAFIIYVLTKFVNALCCILRCNMSKPPQDIYTTSHKKFSEGKQVHVGMETSKTNQTRWE